MKGFYLYCIREKTKEQQTFSIKGIDEKGEVFVIVHRELEAVASEVSLEEFESEEIQKKAQENLGWIKEKALVHEKIIDETMRNNDKPLSLIPMRFGTIFKEETSLRESLNKDYLKIKEVLERIRGKQEWSVKVYLKDRKKLEQVIKEKNEVIKENEREIADLPEGMAFFMEEELKDVISRELKKELDNIAGCLFEKFKKHAEAAVKNKILEKELTGRGEPMVLNTAYLISEDKTEAFKKDVEDSNLNQEMQTKGFYFEYSGPWPAFNFTSY